MTELAPRPPTLEQQIEAVRWARGHVWDIGRRAKLREAEIVLMERRLEAAVETLVKLKGGPQ